MPAPAPHRFALHIAPCGAGRRAAAECRLAVSAEHPRQTQHRSADRGSSGGISAEEHRKSQRRRIAIQPRETCERFQAVVTTAKRLVEDQTLRHRTSFGSPIEQPRLQEICRDSRMPKADGGGNHLLALDPDPDDRTHHFLRRIPDAGRGGFRRLRSATLATVASACRTSPGVRQDSDAANCSNPITVVQIGRSSESVTTTANAHTRRCVRRLRTVATGRNPGREPLWINRRAAAMSRASSRARADRSNRQSGGGSDGAGAASGTSTPVKISLAVASCEGAASRRAPAAVFARSTRRRTMVNSNVPAATR